MFGENREEEIAATLSCNADIQRIKAIDKTRSVVITEETTRFVVFCFIMGEFAFLFFDYGAVTHTIPLYIISIISHMSKKILYKL